MTLKMKKFKKEFLFIFFLLFSSQVFAENQSIYTSVNLKDCKKVNILVADRIIDSEKGEYIFLCDAPKNYNLFLIDDGTRSWYILQKDNYLTSFESDIVYKEIGNFPNVAVNDKVEWRLNEKNEVIGFIFRVYFQAYDSKSKKPVSKSKLYVIDLTTNRPKKLDIADDNLIARKIIDHLE